MCVWVFLVKSSLATANVSQLLEIHLKLSGGRTAWRLWQGELLAELVTHSLSTRRALLGGSERGGLWRPLPLSTQQQHRINIEC